MTGGSGNMIGAMRPRLEALHHREGDRKNFLDGDHWGDCDKSVLLCLLKARKMFTKSWQGRILRKKTILTMSP